MARTVDPHEPWRAGKNFHGNNGQELGAVRATVSDYPHTRDRRFPHRQIAADYRKGAYFPNVPEGTDDHIAHTDVGR